MFPPGTIQGELKEWSSSQHDSKTKWNQVKEAWKTFAKKRKMFNQDNAIYEVVLQVGHLKYKEIYFLSLKECTFSRKNDFLCVFEVIQTY